ncbi:MAG: ABC transporter ATP-binding protein [Bacillota bacterium]|nr:ABC transporter ATP-binding protein [Bacillota bacterium]
MFKRLAESLREYKKETIITPFFVMCEVIMEVSIPFLMANLIDFGIDAGSMAVIFRLGLGLLFMALISLFFGIQSGRSSAIAAAGFAKNLRRDMFYNVQTFSFSNIDKFSPSSIITRLTTDVTNVQQAFQMIIRMATRGPLMMLFALAAAFSINARLSLIFLAAIPFLGLGLYIIMTKSYPLFRKVFKTYDRLNRIVQENVRGIRIVKSFNREDYEKEKFGAVSQAIYNYFSLAEKIVAFNMPLMQFSMYVSMLLISWFGARLIVASGNNPALGLSTGQLMSLMTYTMQILMSLMMLSMVLVMITISRASAERIAELLEEKSDLHNNENPIHTMPNGEIRFENVSFCYSKDADKKCLKDVNLTINPGETVGIIGGTGSAKTTLVQLIPRLYDVTEGRVLVGGVDVRDYDLQNLRDQVAVVLQKNVLFSGTVKENLRWGNREADDEELIRVSKLAQADDFIRTLPKQYDAYIEQGGSNLSGGQKQRLCIARALLKKPKILILDDSTSAVDTGTEALLRRSLREEMPGTTKLIISQRIASVEDADKIIVMDDGKITAVGTHDELLESSRIYREVYQSQVKGGRQIA